MITLVDRNTQDNGFGSGSKTELDVDVYRRLNIVSRKLIGSLPDDNSNPIAYYLSEMEKIQLGDLSNVNAVEIDTFLGSLGVTINYPHSDRLVFENSK